MNTAMLQEQQTYKQKQQLNATMIIYEDPDILFVFFGAFHTEWHQHSVSGMQKAF